MALPVMMPGGFGVLECLEKAKALNSISTSPFIPPFHQHIAA
jgi:hypothetical protein